MARIDIRRERYAYFRSLGFSSIQSRQFRDNSAARGTLEIQSELTRVRREPSTPDRTDRIRRLSTAPRQPATTPTRQRESSGETKSRRLQNFRRWSQRNVGFPSDLLTRIHDINTSAGFDVNSSYGFRVFYHRYVNGEGPDEAERHAEMRDT